jgi:hypothetical protein
MAALSVCKCAEYGLYLMSQKHIIIITPAVGFGSHKDAFMYVKTFLFPKTYSTSI